MPPKPDDEEDVVFETDHLMTKWGFMDGELLEEFLVANGFEPIDTGSEEWFHFSRRVLCEVVECCVLPKIQNDIKPYRVFGNHNPMRVYEVDGVHMSDFKPPPVLRPMSVGVPKWRVLEAAASIYSSRFSEDGTPQSYMTRSAEAVAIFNAESWEV